jgi:hypothetical protein
MVLLKNKANFFLSCTTATCVSASFDFLSFRCISMLFNYFLKVLTYKLIVNYLKSYTDKKNQRLRF